MGCGVWLTVWDACVSAHGVVGLLAGRGVMDFELGAFYELSNRPFGGRVIILVDRVACIVGLGAGYVRSWGVRGQGLEGRSRPVRTAANVSGREGIFASVLLQWRQCFTYG